MKILKDIHLKPKWYLSAALIFIVVLGGVLGKQHVIAPNQEIVLQFANTDITSSDAQYTITIVEQELQRIGAADIQVIEQEDGKMVISYYSDTNVEGIKEILSEQKELALGFVSNKKNRKPLQSPTKEKSKAYYLDVYEIKDGQNSLSDGDGKCAVELKSGQYRFLNPNFPILIDDGYSATGDLILKVSTAFQRSVALSTDNRLRKIPEVRAGPLS